MRSSAFIIRGLLLFGPVMFYVPVKCQEVSAGTTQVQVIGGGQFLWLNDPLGPKNGLMTGRRVYGVGYQVGLGLERKLDRGLRIRAELHWSERHTRMVVDEARFSNGASHNDDHLDVGMRNFRLRSVQVPLLLSWQLQPDLVVLAGPAFSHLLGVQERFRGTRYGPDGQVFEGTERTDRTANFRPMELALILGFEVEGHAGLRFGVRYWQGLTDLEQWEGSSASIASAIQVAVSVPVLRGRSRTT
jgi:hypothetical protein